MRINVCCLHKLLVHPRQTPAACLLFALLAKADARQAGWLYCHHVVPSHGIATYDCGWLHSPEPDH